MEDRDGGEWINGHRRAEYARGIQKGQLLKWLHYNISYVLRDSNTFCVPVYMCNINIAGQQKNVCVYTGDILYQKC